MTGIDLNGPPGQPGRRPVHQALESFGHHTGFEKHAGAWYTSSAEVVAVIDLQSSLHGRQYYVNLGFWLRALGDQTHPKPERCHVMVRLETLLATEETARQRLAALLDLEQGIPDDEREAELVAFLTNRARPLIKRLRTLSDVREALSDGRLAGAAVRGPAPWQRSTR
jgi:hypothetical protein